MVDAAGFRIPGIELEGELGRGSHSIVLRGRRGERRCAIKVARWRGRSLRGFRREAIALARVRDAGVPAVLEVGECSGVPYLAMELVEGETLADRIDRGALPEAAVVELGVQLARTLAAVHRRGLVHRDLKPRNIVLDPATGRPRLVDFGFVAEIDRIGEDAAGTRPYAAPEQLRAPETIDGRADLFALGATLAQCLVGDRPHAAGNQLHERLVAQKISAGLAHLLAQLTATDPDARYPSAEALQADLERVRMGERPFGGEGPVTPGEFELPLVGREELLERLWSGWRAAGGARGETILLEGPQGSGKSRLLAEMALEARGASERVLWAQCQQAAAWPMAALRQLFEGELADAAARGRRDETIAALRQAASGHLASLLPLISDELGELAGRPSPARLGEADATVVEGLAELVVRFVDAAGPLMLCIDDLQWVDPVSREVLLRVAHEASTHPLLFLASARADIGSQTAVSRFAESLGGDRLSRFPLPPLDEVAVAGLVHHYLGTDEMKAELVRRVASLADGTPLGILELLRAFGDEGVLRPHWGSWQFDIQDADTSRIPRSTRMALERRLAELSGTTRHILQVAAIIGRSFDESLLGESCAVDADRRRAALAEARGARLVEPHPHGAHRFVHDSIREALVVEVDEADRREIHQQVAEAMDAREDVDPYAIASHYGAGELEKHPGRTFDVTRAAAELALSRFDVESALLFFDAARRTAHTAQLPLDVDFHRHLGEARLRVGELEKSIDAFSEALAISEFFQERALLLGRLAWVNEMAAEPDQAWAQLDRAFQVLGHQMPTERVGAATQSGFAWLRARFRSVHVSRFQTDRKDLQLLCDLHYQNARLGVEYARPVRHLQSTVQALDVAEKLGESSTLARASAIYGASMAMLGLRQESILYMERGTAMAERVGDPVVYAYCLQLQHVAWGWLGDSDRALEMASRCIGEYGHWQEITDYCLTVSSAHLLEAVRGRNQQAWHWIEATLERVRRHGRCPAVFDAVISPYALASLASLGHEAEAGGMVSGRVGPIEHASGGNQGFFRLISWGARVRWYTETGDLGEEFERLVREFEAEGHDPRRVHLTVVEYYIHVAHARVHQCLRAEEGEREAYVPALRKALEDLRRAARIPLFQAHRWVIEGYHAWLSGSPGLAWRCFAKADELGEQETAPWVLYAVARGRAHMLREQGREDAARDRARTAASLAREHGAAHRLQWVREEFQLGPSAPPSQFAAQSPGGSHTSSSRRRKQLRALLQVARAGARELRPEAQAQGVADELLEALAGEQAVVTFATDAEQGPRVLAVRTRRGETLSEPAASCQAVLERVYRTAEPWPTPGNGDGFAAAEDNATLPADAYRVLAVPLFLQEKVVGAVYLERSSSDEPFGTGDGEFLLALAHQVPVALELARALEEREQLQESLRNAQKMEAVGLLAGGVAHDFNNMLTVIHGALDAFNNPDSSPEDLQEATAMATTGADRARALTLQLLSFSRRHSLDPEPLDLNRVLSETVSMLKRVLGEPIRIESELAEGLRYVKIDRASFEQAIVNLAINARDAMPHGGVLRIRTENVDRDEAWADRHVGASAGRYVRVTISDTGEGISPEVQGKIFDPFFTTKQPDSGTGLGLSTVYGFVKQSGGQVELSSAVGRGTSFFLYFPETREPLERAGTRQHAPSRRSGSETILVVEDDELVRRSLRRILEDESYRVLFAENGSEALELARKYRSELELVITDVLMPDVNGPELVRRLHDLGLDVKVLYVSGYADGELIDRGVLSREAAFVQKPFSAARLKQRVREMLEA